ncbi:MAG: gephyrin-like molybdotransferase Glp [Bacteroidota bacterium]
MTNNLIPVETAKELVMEHCKSLPAILLPISQTLNTILAEDTFARIDMPGFDQSAMDGYAFCFNDYDASKTLEVAGESFAGNKELLPLKKNTATRIFTGAPVPSGADTVVMQEHTIRTGDQLQIDSPKITTGLNVRKQGSEIHKGALALKAGIRLTPAAIGFLAGIGISEVKVFGFPAITIIATGKELVQPGNPLSHGQVYESNTLTLTAALQHLHITNVKNFWVDDNVEDLIAAVNNALQQSDLILITGGVSVGDYDYVIPALQHCGVETIFHKVKQRPGKPLFFGRKENKMIFGLPGNPSSVLSCYYNYVLLALQKLMHRNDPLLNSKKVPLENSFEKNIGLTHFLKGYFDNEKVRYLTAQESYRLSSFALSNCLIEIPADVEKVPAGELVTVHLL